MIGHPYTNLDTINSIGLWYKDSNIVGACIYDMYFGEASILVLKDYEYLYQEMLDYAYHNLKDENGLGIAIYDKDYNLINKALNNGFILNNQKENIMDIKLNNNLSYKLPEGIKIEALDPASNIDKFLFLMWQGFNHGDDYNEFLNSDDYKLKGRPRKHFNKELSLVAIDEKNEYVAYISLWYIDGLDYAYLEPVCTIPSYRGKGIAKALIYEGFNRVKELGANIVYVESDMEFYKRIGFIHKYHYDFYWRK
jgi:GNAT superfamily N-acetyltransferase